MRKRILSALLASLMLVGMLPIMGVQAAPTTVIATVNTQSAFVGDTLTWTLNVEPTTIRYQTRVRVLLDGAPVYEVAYGAIGVKTHSYVVLKPGNYVAEAMAIDLADNAVVSSNSVTTKVSLKPGPTITSVASINETAMTLNWTAVAGAAGYKIFTATSPTGPYTLRRYSTTTSGAVSFLKPGVRTFFKVSAYIESGGKKYDLTLQSPYKIGVPVGTASITKIENNSANRVFLSWKLAPGATGYEVWRSTTANSGYVLIKNATSTSYVDLTVKRGRSYYYKILPHSRLFAVNYYGQWSMMRSLKITK